MAESLVGRQLGKYEVRRLLGEGGLGSVYLARDPLLDREVALKILKPALVSDPALHKRFQKEAVAMARLNHPNIIQIYALEQEAAVMFLVMEYLQGESLGAITARGALPPATALRHLRQAAAALAYAHQQGVLHRDIKAANLMVFSDGQLKVLDFGLAAVASEATMLTQAGEILGTPHYMAPEQALGKPADRRSDLYALGIVFYEMLAGQLPFRGDSALAVLHQQVSMPLPPLPAGLAAREPQLATVLAQLTAKDPAERYQSAADLLTALDRRRDAARAPAPAAPAVPETVNPFHGLPSGFSTAASAVVHQAITGYAASRFSSAPPPQFSSPAAPAARAAAAPVTESVAPAPPPPPARESGPPAVAPARAASRPAPGPPAADPQRTVAVAIRKYQAGLTVQAMEILDAAKRMDYKAWKLLGAIHQHRGRPQESLAALREAAKYAEAEPELLSNLGVLYQQRDQSEEAVREFQRALNKDPRCSVARYNLAIQLVKDGHCFAALREVNTLLAYEPGHRAGQELLRELS